MRVDDIPLLAALKGRLQYLNRRQGVIAENVANADVAGFTPKEVKPPSFSEMIGRSSGAGGVTLAMSDPGHLAGPSGSASSGGAVAQMKTVDAPDSETRMDGNSVVLEEEMLKMAESRMAYDTAIGLYQHSLNMLKTAARKPS